MAFGSPSDIFSAKACELERIVKKKSVRNILRGADNKKLTMAFSWLEDPANSLITLADSDYPRLLLNIPDPPPLLYFKGQRKILNTPALAVVGSRNATPQGLF